MTSQEKEIRAKIDQALASGDYKQVSRLSNMLNRIRNSKLLIEQESKAKAIAAASNKISKLLIDTLEPVIQAGDLDLAQGVYFNWTFGDDPVLKLEKPANRPKHRIRKHPEIKTIDLVRQLGNTPWPEDPKVTYSDKYFTSPDPNFRYTKIRVPLLALSGK